jgi:tetratricopeptide (TPR) repeat protein
LSELEREFIGASAKRRRLKRGAGTMVAVIVLAAIGYFFLQTLEARKRAEELVEFMVWDLRDKLKFIGRPELMDSVNARVNSYYEKIGAKSGSPDFERHRVASHENLGDRLLDQGKLDEARNAYEQSLEIVERLAKADPSNSWLQRDLSVMYGKRGDVELAAGKLDEARNAYEQSLEIVERLAKADPVSSRLQSDLSVSYEQRGDVELAAGKLGEARNAYEQSLAIRERLVKADPSSSGWQRDLSVSYERLGNVLTQQNQREKALAFFESGRAIGERLTKLDPSNAVWKNNLERVNGKIAELKK